MDADCLLATLDSDHLDERIQVVLTRSDEGSSTISLVQQSWAESLGWYTQQVMNLTPDQVRELRSALGTPTAGRLATQVSRDRLAADPQVMERHQLVCVPFPPPARRAHSA